MKSLLTNLVSERLSTCAAITLMFTYTILLDRDFACSCKSQGFVPCFTLFGIVLVVSLIPLCQCRKCCEGQSSCCNRRFLFDKLILEEEDNVLKEILRKSAKDQLTKDVEDRIRSGQWEKCFDVAIDLINASARPTISEEQQPLLARDADNLELLVRQNDDNQHEE